MNFSWLFIALQLSLHLFIVKCYNVNFHVGANKAFKGAIKRGDSNNFCHTKENDSKCIKAKIMKSSSLRSSSSDDDNEEPDWDALRSKLEEMTGTRPATPPNVIPAQQGDVSESQEMVEAWEGEFKPGMVLVANPQFYYSNQIPNPFGKFKPDPQLLQQFGFEGTIPKTIPGDKQADLLPCVLVVENSAKGGTIGFVINRRTGYLCGDLGEEENLKAFMIQPIWFGGVTGAKGLGMIHSYPDIAQTLQLTEDGLYYGGDLESANEKVLKGTGTGFNFRFFLQFTKWGPGEMEQQVQKGMWIPVKCSKMVILKARDRAGPYKCPPMWTDIIQKLGPPYNEALDFVYD